MMEFFAYAYLGTLAVMYLWIGIAGVWHAVSPDDKGVRVEIWWPI